MGRRMDLFVATSDLRAPGHAVYDRLNATLDRRRFDERVEAACARYSCERNDGRPSFPSVRDFRMPKMGYVAHLGA